uniref:Putative secreted protein n=1 Tax=Amblyomma triste TaxID=251400 RepID=A0A023G180_AMBTT
MLRSIMNLELKFTTALIIMCISSYFLNALHIKNAFRPSENMLAIYLAKLGKLCACIYHDSLHVLRAESYNNKKFSRGNLRLLQFIQK